MENYYLRKRVITTLVSTGLLTKVFAVQAFAEKELELTTTQFLVLGFVCDNDGLYQRQISAVLLKDRPNITRIINILEKKGLVERIPDKSNRKVFKIHATEKGREVHKYIEPTMIAVREEATKGISNDEIEFCMSILERIQDNLKEKVKMQI